ncbi:uncharacterized protein LOC132283314 [Cornus florida]|uniref:uncharacterized protein LOC132283314 n=1 Tax=Cornus florida TaxID=4283 RepID=UPI002897A3C1|nr:uncharacterized protein LOC132283314 [Cornus florida]XP_059641236.1 uncharacterized protein LOC132283314 [Cornus florida]XP_059641237.1 uncharacterized protein LOC132283314 [Cornus florida]
MDTVDEAEEHQTLTSDPLTNQFGSLNDLCHELSSLQDLACRGSWRSILDKVARARKLSLLSKPHEHLTYLSYNLLALTKLRRFSDASAELDSLEDDLDSSQYNYQSYPQHYPNRSGSMVPFALRWLHAELPSKLGKRQETLDRFYLLLDLVRTKLTDNESKNLSVSDELWRKRECFVINSLISHHLSNKEFGVCLNLVNDLINRSGDTKNPVLLSKLGFIQMQIGDLERAKATFDMIEGLVKEGKGEVELRNLVSRNKALIYLVGKDYVSAVREYDECVERDGSDVVAINNKAICLMYLRDLSDSIKVLESALESIPTVALNETLVVNLCSMYELAYVNHSDIKRTLSNWIARVAPDDFDSSSTRI